MINIDICSEPTPVQRYGGLYMQVGHAISQTFTMAEEFNTWINGAELTDNTVQLLNDNGFTSLKSCKLLTTNIIQKSFAKSLSLAQTLLLQQAVESLVKPPPITAPPSVATPLLLDPERICNSAENNPTLTAGGSTTPDTVTAPMVSDLSMTALLQMVDDGLKRAPANVCQGQGNPAIFDPFQFDSVKTVNSNTYREIKDFITLFQEERSESNSFKIGDIELKLPESKPKLQDISPLQYMEGSLRILREMVLKDDAKVEQIMHYVGYLLKISNLGQRFQWRSVIKYDSGYRKAQANTDFTWGADNSFMMQVFLRERTYRPAHLTTDNYQAGRFSSGDNRHIPQQPKNSYYARWVLDLYPPC